MSRRINFSRRGELIVGQSNLSCNQPQPTGNYAANMVSENTSGLENMRLLPVTTAHEKYTTFMSNLGSTKESILSTSSYAKVGLGQQSAHNNQSIFVPKQQTQVNQNHDSNYAYQRHSTANEKGEYGNPLRTNFQTYNPSRQGNEHANGYAPYYKPQQQTILQNDSRFYPNSYNGFEGNKDVSFKTASVGDHAIEATGQAAKSAQYAFPANYKFDFKSYENYRKPSVANNQAVRESEIAFESVLKQKEVRMAADEQVNVTQRIAALQAEKSQLAPLKFEEMQSLPKVETINVQQPKKTDFLLDEPEEQPQKKIVDPNEQPAFVQPATAKSSENEENEVKAKPQELPEQETAAALFECYEGCGRMFSKEALKHHEKICKKIFQSKRKIFNSQLKRVPVAKGQADPDNPYGASQKVGQLPKDKKSAANNWEKKSYQLRTDLKEAKKTGNTQNDKKGREVLVKRANDKKEKPKK